MKFSSRKAAFAGVPKRTEDMFVSLVDVVYP